MDPGSCPVREFFKKKRIKSAARFLLPSKKFPFLTQKKAQTFFPNQEMTTIIIRRASHNYV